MRTKAHKLQREDVRFPIDQKQIGMNVAFAMAMPVADQWIGSQFWWKRPVIRKKPNHVFEIPSQRLASQAWLFPLCVALEVRELLIRSHLRTNRS